MSECVRSAAMRSDGRARRVHEGRDQGVVATDCKGWAVQHFRRTRGDDGAAAVEFALLFPLFVMLTFGMISGAIVLNDKMSLTHGVREAARYGATLPYSSTDTYAFLDTIRTTARGDAFGQIGTSTATYCVALRRLSDGAYYHVTDSATTALSGNCPGGPTLTAGTVLVMGAKPAEFNLILEQLPLTLGSTSVARYEGVS